MTELTITPKTADKTARFRGTVAAGEHVAVTIKGGAEWLGDNNGAHLSLRVIDFVTGRTLALFPRPEETLEDGDEPDAWSVSAEDPDDLFCNLNLNTDRMVNAARHMLRVPVLFVMGAKDDENPATTRTLYFRDRYEVEFWPERVGDDTPYDLDRWPKQIDEWTELVAEFGTRLTTAETSISQAESRVNAAIGDIPQTVETAVTQSNSGKADKVANATNGNLAALAANGNLDDSGKKPSDFADAAQFATHKDNTTIHIAAMERSTWNAKYDKPSGGIPKSDLAKAVRTSLGKADSAIQEHQSLAAYVNGGVYDGDAKKILLKHDSVTVAEIDATAFIKDGMISEVKIVGDNLVIVFNADAGKESILIPLTQIFNPANYYDKTAADGRFVQKETGKGLSANDYTTAEKQKLAGIEAEANKTVVDSSLSPNSENPVQNKVVTEAVSEQITRLDVWTVVRTENATGAVVDTATLAASSELMFRWDEGSNSGYRLFYFDGEWTMYGRNSQISRSVEGGKDSASLTFSNSVYTWTWTRHGSLKAMLNDVAAALALKADASSLPYALVTVTPTAGAPFVLAACFPIKYTYGGSTVEITADDANIGILDDGESGYTIEYNAETIFFCSAEGIYVNSAVDGLTFGANEDTPDSSTQVLGFTPTYALADRAMNQVVVASPLPENGIAIAFPAPTDGKVRDFLVRLVIPAGDAPQIAYPSDVKFENADGSFPEVNTDESAAATTLLMFTETAPATGTGVNATPARFLVKGEALKEVS